MRHPTQGQLELRELTAVIPVRATKNDKREWAELAKSRGMTLSQLVRHVLRREIKVEKGTKAA